MGSSLWGLNCTKFNLCAQSLLIEQWIASNEIRFLQKEMNSIWMLLKVDPSLYKGNSKE